MKFCKKPIEVEAYQLTEEKEIHTREGTLKGYPGDWIITGIQGEQYPCGKEIFEQTYEPAESRPAPSAEPKFNSTDLLLFANDEWKRRGERKHNHEQKIPWCVGFINGFLTDKKWARDWLDKIQNDAEEKLRSSSEVSA